MDYKETLMLFGLIILMGIFFVFLLPKEWSIIASIILGLAIISLIISELIKNKRIKNFFEKVSEFLSELRP